MGMKKNALLLIGPTGSGKTPLGNLIQERGFGNRKCFHFDFGQNLRQAGESPFLKERLGSSDLVFIQKVLREGLLLENETFHIAEKIFRAFVDHNAIKDEDLILLNGLPRHVDQAEEVGRLVAIQRVMVLECSPETVQERIRLNSGGDRGGRADDSLEEIQKKLDLFQSRTLPLMNYFTTRNVPVETCRVEVHTTALELMKQYLENYL
jgi:adenylate kinase family enzyme